MELRNMQLQIKDIVKACNGRLLCGNPDTVVTSVEIDSRKITAGALFVPIHGQKTNAHIYIEQTFAQGAVATLTQEHDAMDDTEHCWIYVQNTQYALQQIASAYCNQFDVPVVGITGSVGKTSTREMVALALSAERNVMQTKGNANSQIGLPLTMFQFEKEHTAAVIEMGISEFDEMDRLVRIAYPDYAIITNIGIAHIEYLKTRENIMAEKLKIADQFHDGSILFLNGDDEMLAGLRKSTSLPVVYYGTQPWCDYRAENIQINGLHTIFTVHTPTVTTQVTLPVLGIHHILNALASIAVAESIGLSVEKAVGKLKLYQPPVMRQTIYEISGITWIDDSYNSSPDSVKSGIDVLCSLPNQGKKIAVLADMMELGNISQQAHFDVGAFIAETKTDILITVGPRAVDIAKGAIDVNPNMKVYVCMDNLQAVAYLKETIQKGDTVIVKGSRSMKTDEVVKAFL